MNVNVNIDLVKLPGKNGNCFFVVNDIEGLEVNLLSQTKSIYNGKSYTKRHPIKNFKKGNHKATGKAIRMYQYAWNCGDIEIRLGDQVEVIKNSATKVVSDL